MTRKIKYIIIRIVREVKEIVIEFTNKKDVIIQKKIKRFEELKVRYFNQTITDKEEIEFDNIEKWLKIHNANKIAM